jgi:hypothetical protein
MAMTARTSEQIVELPAVMPPVSARGRGTFAFQPASGADNIVWGTLSGDYRIDRDMLSAGSDIFWAVPPSTTHCWQQL